MLLTRRQLQHVDRVEMLFCCDKWTSYLQSTDLFVATNYMNAYILIMILETINN